MTDDVRRDLNKINLKLQKCKSKDERKDLYGEYKMLKKTLKGILDFIINIYI